MSGGVVTGGWGFVVAAYSVTMVALTIYGISLITRLRDARAQQDRETR